MLRGALIGCPFLDTVIVKEVDQFKARSETRFISDAAFGRFSRLRLFEH
jgi:hypothetical protein